MSSRALSGSGSVAMGSSALSLFLLASWSWCRRATSAFRFSKSFWLNIRRWSQSSLDPAASSPLPLETVKMYGTGAPPRGGVLPTPDTACGDSVPSLHLSSICSQTPLQQTKGSTQDKNAPSHCKLAHQQHLPHPGRKYFQTSL